MRYVFYTFLCLLLYAFQSATAQINVEKLPNRVDQTNPPTITSVELTSKLVKSKEGTIIDTAKLIQSPPQPVAPEYTENKGVQNSGTMDSATRKLREIAISSYYHSIEAQNKASKRMPNKEEETSTPVKDALMDVSGMTTLFFDPESAI